MKFSEYWQSRLEDVETDRTYASTQIGKCIVSELLIRGFEQMAIPIEEAMADEEPPYGDDAA